MAFEWLERLQRERARDPRFKEKALAAYRLGKKGGGALAGVAIQAGDGCCEAAARLAAGPPLDPADVPALPLAACDRRGTCRCLYRPVMTYQRGAGAAADGDAPAADADPDRRSE